MGGASSIGGEDVRPSRDVQSLLMPESHEFIRGSMSMIIITTRRKMLSLHFSVMMFQRSLKERNIGVGISGVPFGKFLIMGLSSIVIF